MAANRPTQLPRLPPPPRPSRTQRQQQAIQALAAPRPPCFPPAYLGDRRAAAVRAMLNGDCTMILNGDSSVREAVLAEFKPLLLRVRQPSPRLIREFLTSLTSHHVEDYDSAGGRGYVNVTSTAFKATARWLRRRSSDLRSHTLRTIQAERRNSLLNGSYPSHAIWDATLTRQAKAATARLWNNLLTANYVDMDEFNVTDAGYRKLQRCVQDVWDALDNNGCAADALLDTTWRTANMHVPSRTGWDVATSLQLSVSELNI